MSKELKAGYTKTGFSKAGFAACSHYDECLMGKLSCFYADIDPEVKEYCFCYQRNQRKNESKEMYSLEERADKTKEENKEVEQLSLF